ncbi:class GN sortase [Ketobacter sp.]|uniref:class GN sortase n=1 Tax=Ketobacter sp. TaxID=2083498 RepID=UPI000F1A3CF0|nr:class GN sortase [Ketobacter sp.]RLT99394.1 MAG: class GN sortase [Ketobacter sp.]
MRIWRRRLALLLMVGAIWLLGESAYLAAKAQLAQVLLDDAWQKHLQDGRAHRPWPWADTSPIARLLFPRQDKKLVILAGASGRNLAFGPAHLSASVAPGQAGVSVIGGHRDTHFAFLREVELGEQFLLQSRDGGLQWFEIVQIQVTDVRDSEIALQADEPVLALVACYPFNALDSGGPLRYLVIARRIQEGAAIRPLQV